MIRLDGRGPNLLGRVLDTIKGIGRRGHATRGHQFDELRTVAKLVPNGTAYGVGPVGDMTEIVTQHLAGTESGLEGRSHIPVAARLRNRTSRSYDSRARTKPGLDRANQTRHMSTGISHRRKSPQHGRLGELRHRQGLLDG